MYHLTILWLIIVAGTATVAYLAGWRRGRRFERELWGKDYDIVRRHHGR